MLAIIDGDVLCYQACYGIWEDRLKEIGLIRNQMRIIALNEDGEKAPITFTKEQETKALLKAWEHFKRSYQHLLDRFYCTDVLCAVKGQNNFRDIMYPEYKAKRHPDPDKRNLFVPVLRELAVAEGYAIAAHGREADDYIRIWAVEAQKSRDPYKIFTIDKDLRCIPGSHVNIMRKHERGIDQVAANMYGKNFGEWNLQEIEVSAEEAMQHYYQQLIKGDMTDNIPGVLGYGEVKARKLVEKCKTEEEMQEAVVSAYVAVYQDKWQNELLANGKMIHLQRHYNDYFSPGDWPIWKELAD